MINLQLIIELEIQCFQNFVKECENDYNRLKSRKVQMSVKDKNIIYMKKDFFIDCMTLVKNLLII